MHLEFLIRRLLNQKVEEWKTRDKLAKRRLCCSPHVCDRVIFLSETFEKTSEWQGTLGETLVHTSFWHRGPNPRQATFESSLISEELYHPRDKFSLHMCVTTLGRDLLKF